MMFCVLVAIIVALGAFGGAVVVVIPAASSSSSKKTTTNSTTSATSDKTDVSETPGKPDIPPIHEEKKKELPY